MKINNFLFDLSSSQEIQGHIFHGGGKYAKKVFLGILSSNLTTDWKIYALYNAKKELDTEISAELKKANIELIDINSYTLAEVITKYHVKRIYSALPTDYFFINESRDLLYSTIHGLRLLEINEKVDSLQYYTKTGDKLKALAKIILRSYLRDKYYKQYQRLLTNSKVLTVSNHTKYSILSFFPQIKLDIPVFYSPDVTEFSDNTEFPETLDTSNYYLLVGSSRWLKNNLRSIIALDQLFSEHTDLKQTVVLTGVSDKAFFLKHIKNKERFFFYKYVSENFLTHLYKNAFAFIYLSLNEGFGYPPLDAMKYGVPVLASPFTSIPEVCSNAVLYGNPFSIPEIKNRILQFSNSNIYYQLKNDGLKRYAEVKNKQDADLTAMISFLFKSDNSINS